MTLVDKVEYVIEHDGTEIGDGFQGLVRFFQYVYSDGTLEHFLQPYRELIEDVYENVLIEQESYNRLYRTSLIKDIKTGIKTGILSKEELLKELENE